MEVVFLTRHRRCFADLLNGGQEQANQDSDDGDYDEKFDEGKTRPTVRHERLLNSENSLMRTRETTAPHHRCLAGACRMPRTLPNWCVDAGTSHEGSRSLSAWIDAPAQSGHSPSTFKPECCRSADNRATGGLPVFSREPRHRKRLRTERTGRVINGIGVMDGLLEFFDGPVDARPKGDGPDEFGRVQPLVLALRRGNRSRGAQRVVASNEVRNRGPAGWWDRQARAPRRASRPRARGAQGHHRNLPAPFRGLTGPRPERQEPFLFRRDPAVCKSASRGRHAHWRRTPPGLL